MNRHAKALLLIAGAVISACAARTVPYVATIPLDATESPWVLGRTRCDLAGRPYRQVSIYLTLQMTDYVLRHEDEHIAQVRAAGSCEAFMLRYQMDSAYRLQMESAAYCAVVILQRSQHAPIDPPLDTIALILKTRYGAEYTDGAIRTAMTCR